MMPGFLLKQEKVLKFLGVFIDEHVTVAVFFFNNTRLLDLKIMHYSSSKLSLEAKTRDSVKCGCGRRMRTADGGRRTADGQKK